MKCNAPHEEKVTCIETAFKSKEMSKTCINAITWKQPTLDTCLRSRSQSTELQQCKNVHTWCCALVELTFMELSSRVPRGLGCPTSLSGCTLQHFMLWKFSKFTFCSSK